MTYVLSLLNPGILPTGRIKDNTRPTEYMIVLEDPYSILFIIPWLFIITTKKVRMYKFPTR